MKEFNVVWDSVRSILKDGGVPTIEVTESMRVNEDGHKWDRRINSNKNGYVLTQAGHRMTCANPGCSRKLKKNPKCITCCDKCKDELRFFCESALKVLNGKDTPFDFPMYLRTIRGVPRGAFRRTIKQSRLIGIDHPEWRVRDEKKGEEC